MTIEAKATAWRIAQAIAVSLLLAVMFFVVHLRADAGIVYPDPCKACLAIYPEWVCWLQGCW